MLWAHFVGILHELQPTCLERRRPSARHAFKLTRGARLRQPADGH